jgi:molybdopterin synthase catalytic subunit
MISLRQGPFDPWKEIEAYQDIAFGHKGTFGATASFVGTMRNFNEGDRVCRMNLEHYPGMTEKHLEQIVAEARRRWDMLDALVIHRVGTIAPDEPIVLVAVWSVHRGAAFDACRYVMEELKSRAPFWKKELLAGGGDRWVEANTNGYQQF